MSEQRDRPLTDEERQQAMREQLKQLRVADLAYDMMVSLITVAYQKLGLTEQTRDLRDLPGAHLAIELLRASLLVMEKEEAAERYRDLRSTLAQMQLGYVQAMQAAGGQGAATDTAAGPAGDAATGDGEADTSASGEAEEPAGEAGQAGPGETEGAREEETAGTDAG